MAKIKDEPLKEWEDIGIGDQVKHVKWGVGTVLFRSGSGDAAKAIVVFPEEGQKKLMLKFAKLKKVGSAPKSESKSRAAKLAPVVIAAESDEPETPLIKRPPTEEIETEELDEDLFKDGDEERIKERGKESADKFDE